MRQIGLCIHIWLAEFVFQHEADKKYKYPQEVILREKNETNK